MVRAATTITLAGVEQTLRPCFSCYRDIEQRCGMSLREVYTLCFTGQLQISHAAVIVTLGMKAADMADADEQKVAQLLYDSGMWDDVLIAQISEFVASLGWTPEQRKKILAEEEKEAATPST